MNNARNSSSSSSAKNHAATSLFRDVERGDSGHRDVPFRRQEMESMGPLARTSPSRNGRSAEKDRYVAQLELEVDGLKERCTVYGQKVKELQYELNKVVVKVSNKKDLCNNFRWSNEDTSYSEGINKFCKEWLFLWCKFFHTNWNEYLTSRKSLCALVFRHCPVPAGADKDDHWTRIVAPTMAKKYSDMQCNINNDVHKALSSE